MTETDYHREEPPPPPLLPAMLFSFIVLIICVSVQPGGVPPAPAPALADHKNLRDALRKLSGAGGTLPPTNHQAPSVCSLVTGLRGRWVAGRTTRRHASHQQPVIEIG